MPGDAPDGPAESAAAFPTALILTQQLPFVHDFAANRNCPQSSVSHFVAHPTGMPPMAPQWMPRIAQNSPARSALVGAGRVILQG